MFNGGMANECFRLVGSELGIPPHAISVVSENRFACVVPEVWLNSFGSLQRVTALPEVTYEHLSSADARLLLSPSYSRLLSGWTRINLVVIKKCPGLVESLIEQPLCLGNISGMCHSSIKDFISKERMKCLQQDANHRYNSAIQLTYGTDTYKPCIKEYNTFICEVLYRIYSLRPILLGEVDTPADISFQSLNGKIESALHPGVLQAYAVIESNKAFYILQPFVLYTVSDLVTFSPSKLKEDVHTTRLFVLFELLKAIRHLHSLGISIYNMTLKDIAVDDQLWLQVILPPIENLYHTSLPIDFTSRAGTDNQPNGLSDASFMLSDLESVVQKWVYHEISNFEYLMSLNQLAGRNKNDPNHYPILPWVIDFLTPFGNWRDLTKTKYRLNKGDQQLDLTYDISNPESIMLGAGQTPFHVSDFLSDITYYVYKARRTTKDILCKFVRPRWVPNHYPVSLQRLYEWTPDECIPEFFTDPEIFSSIHSDLPDLELPSWVGSAEEFVSIHREILESDHVSNQLHHWIDLTFGYKLSGSAAISSKNICLQLVDHHKQLLNHGVVQLFTCPHPPRHQQIHKQTAPLLNTMPTKDFEETNAVQQMRLMSIKNPCASVEQLESLFEFTMRTMNSLPPLRKIKESNSEGRHRLLVARDMQTVGCLIVELFLPKVWALNEPHNSLRKRYERVRRILKTHITDLPLCVRNGVIYLLNLNEDWDPGAEVEHDLDEVFSYPSVGLDGLPPPNIDILLHPSVRLLCFPFYFSSLYTYLSKLERLSVQIVIGGSFSQELSESRTRIENQKVSLLTNLLMRMSQSMGPEGLNLVIPHILELLQNHGTSVQCAWSLFYPVAQALGPSNTAHYLLQPLISLFDTEETTVKYLKIYHRSFINQLIVCLGLKVFLDTFSTLLIEAVSGYKNFDSTRDRPQSNSVVSDDIVNEELVKMKMEQTPVEHLRFFPDCAETDMEKFMPDEVFDTEAIDSDGRKTFGEVEDDQISVESGSQISHEILSPAPEPERKASTNLDSISIESDNKDSVVLGDEEADTDSHEGGNDSEGLCITVTPQKLALTSEIAMVNTNDSDYNIANVAAETIKWLAHRLGPVLTAKYLSRNLLRMLALCYIGEEQLVIIDSQGIFLSTSNKYVVGDHQAILILECLSFIATLYGEHVILLQYLQHICELDHLKSENEGIDI